MKKLLKKIFKKSIKVDENDKFVKIYLQHYFEELYINWSLWMIHFIETKTTKEKIVITITLGRPGLLIGKGGKTIDELSQYLSRRLEKPVEIKIIEFDIFRYNY